MFTQNEIMLMIGVVSFLLILILILTIFDIKEYLQKRNKRELQNIDSLQEESKVKEPETKKNVVEVFEVQDEKSPVDFNEESTLAEEMKEEDIFLEEDEVINEVPKEEVLSVQINNPKVESINLDEEFDKALSEVSEEDAISKFEEEQERTAIISLDELMKKSNELYNDNEYVQYDDGNEPITIDEVMAKYNRQEVKNDIQEEKVVETREIRKPYSKKETIPFISSIYGVEKNGLAFENTATYEKLNKENNDFMTKLREMKENK